MLTSIQVVRPTKVFLPGTITETNKKYGILHIALVRISIIHRKQKRIHYSFSIRSRAKIKGVIREYFSVGRHNQIESFYLKSHILKFLSI